MPSTKVDPDFLAFYRSACAMAASILRAGAALTAKQKKALIADLKSEDEARAKAALPLLGLSQSVIDEQWRLLSNFVARHPVPKDAAQLQTFFEHATVAAKASFPDSAGGGPAPDPMDEINDELGLPDTDGSGDSGDTGDNTACLNGCAAQGAALTAAAIAAWAAASAACTALIFPPAQVVCGLVALANFTIATYEMKAVVDRCAANCG